MSDQATLAHFRAATERLPALSEQDADTAFLHMSKLRDRLVHADENLAACRVDEAIERLQEACRLLTSRPVGVDRTLVTVGETR
jgi:hypothetical protein